MKTVDDVARAALGAIGSVDMDGLVLAHGWVNSRYAELAATLRYRHLRRAITVTLPAPVTAGTVDVAAGGRTVTGTGTAFLPAFAGRWIRFRQAWYEIASVASTTSLSLASDFTEEAIDDGGFTIVQRSVVLPADIRFTTSWVVARRWTRLEEVSYRTLVDLIAPGRFYLTTLGASGGWVAHVGGRPDGIEFEIYPYSTQAETVHLVAWSAPPTLRPDDALPPSIDPHILKEGVLVDVYRYAMGKAAIAGRVDVMGTWRNEMNSQRTVWGQFAAQAHKADRGLDDAEWLIQTVGATRSGPNDIRTARDQVIATGTRP